MLRRTNKPPTASTPGARRRSREYRRHQAAVVTVGRTKQSDPLSSASGSFRTFKPRVRIELNADYLKRVRQEAWLKREKQSDQSRRYGPWLLDSEAEALASFLKATPAPEGVEEEEWRKMIGLDAEISKAEYKRLVDLLIVEAVRLVIRKKKKNS